MNSDPAGKPVRGPGRRRDAVRDAANRQLFRVGQVVAPRLSTPVVRRIAAAAAVGAEKLNWSHLRTYRRNLELTLGDQPSAELIRAGVASWIRNQVEMLGLPGWDPAEIVSRVQAVGEDELRAAYAGPGAVVALPHLANWDLAGAWACLTGLPVTTVAENLGDKEFAAFTGVRNALGLEVLRHDDPEVLGELMAAVRSQRVVCLLSDRDLPGRGLEVDWAGHRVTMPAGPALVARRTGATLFAATCHYTATGMTITISPPLATRSGREGLAAMTQDVADWFLAGVRRSPQDWHMMQPFFPGSH